jgi:hypothetical protein
MATIDEELSQIERDIRTLKIEYEQFFGGGRPRPPADTQWRVESMMRRYSERGGELSVGQRFRFNNLAQTYAKYVDMWRKKTAQKESSYSQHHYGAAAKAIEAERSRKAAAQAAVSQEAAAEGTGAHGAVTAHEAGEAGSHSAGHRAEPRKVAEGFALSFTDPEHENEKVQKLYRKLLEARSETGEKAGAPNLKDFERFVLQKTKELKDKGGKEIEYTVSIEGGRVKLKARISS